MFRSLITCCLLSALWLVTGCQPTREAQQMAPTQGPGPIMAPRGAQAKQTLQLWTIWNTDPRQSALTDLVAAFQTAHPEILVQVTNHEPDAYKTAIRVALGGNQPPDIYFVWSGEKMLHSFVRGGNVADLTPDLDAGGGQWRRSLSAAALQSYTFDGKTYGVPYLLQSTFFIYNKKLFQQHGWQVPQTWPELVKLCEKIKAAGIIPIALGNQQKWPAMHFPSTLVQRMIGASAAERQYDPTGPGDYSDPAWTKSLQMLKELQDMGAFPKSPNGVDRAMARTLFYGGKAAIFYTGTWDFARLSQGGEAPESFWEVWDFFNFPAVPGGKGEQDCLAGSADGYVISSKTAHREAAVKFMQFMTSVEQAREFAQKCQELVQVEDAVTDEIAGPRLQAYRKAVAAAPRLSAWADTLMEESVAQAYMTGIQELLEGKATPEQVMQRVRSRQQQVRREMQERQAGGRG
jgi:raffinose/stachyose/melibiose transport system substrate-binding protein